MCMLGVEVIYIADRGLGKVPSIQLSNFSREVSSYAGSDCIKELRG